MSAFEFEVKSGKTVRFPTAGKYCDRNIVVTATRDEEADAAYQQGVADGKQSEYDSFWDEYQQNGSRAVYDYAFAGTGWNDKTFKPKYDIKPVSVSHFFSASNITDLRKMLNDSGVALDMSNVSSMVYFAQNSKLETIPVLDTRKIKDLSYFLFGNKLLHTVEKVVLADGTQTFSNYTFYDNPVLVEVRFEGIIGKNFTITASPLLSAESVQSIIDHLKDLTGQTAQRVSFHSDVLQKLTVEQTEAITAKNWTL